MNSDRIKQMLFVHKIPLAGFRIQLAILGSCLPISGKKAILLLVKSAKTVFAAGAVLLLVIGIYLKITSSNMMGGFVSRYGHWQNSAISANAVFFFAAVMAGMLWLVVWSEQKDKRDL